MYPAVLLVYLISAAVILVASLALIVQVSLPYNKTGRASVLLNFILVFLRDLPVVKISPKWITGPEQGKSSGGIVTFSLWTDMFRPQET